MATAASNPFSVSIAALPAWVPPLGTYTAVGNNTMADVDPCPEHTCSYSAVEGQSAVLNDWCGGTYADDAGTWGSATQWGGGHAGYWGNEFYAFDFDSLTWARLTEPSTDVGSNGCNFDGQGLYPDGAPTPPHTYDNERYVPAADIGTTQGSYVAVIIAAIGDCPPTTRYTSHFFDIAAREWSTSTNEFPENARYYGFLMTAYDTTRKVIWALDEGAPSHIGKLDVATKTWTSVPHGSNSYVSASAKSTGGYCPMHDLCVFATTSDSGPNAWWIWDPVAETLTPLNATGTAPSGGHGMEWCAHPNVQKFYCFEYSGNEVKTLTPPASDPKNSAWTWSSETFAPHGDPGDVVPNEADNPCYNRFRWAHKLKSFVWHGERHSKLNIFRPAGAI
jgi:hypothetical protein